MVNDLNKFDRHLYDFEAVVTDDKNLTLVTNVTIHIVGPDEELAHVMR